ncbi:hypothetical protein [Streptomyces cahuitamycinicus]|nr:hypothetical protein [Streptomyces cahuitamycinicus]
MIGSIVMTLPQLGGDTGSAWAKEHPRELNDAFRDAFDLVEEITRAEKPTAISTAPYASRRRRSRCTSRRCEPNSATCPRTSHKTRLLTRSGLKSELSSG